MKLKIYQVDAFAEKPFEGNPAAIMQAIAEENNLAETAFFIPADDGFHIRWFTPTKEVKLCGHATLAAAYTQLIPYWSDRLGKSELSAKQVSARVGKVLCELDGDRVLISGTAVKYMEGSIEIRE